MGERTMLDFRRDLRAGQEYEDFVQLQLWRHGIVVLLNRSAKFQWEYGESLGGLEIKLDRRLQQLEVGRRSFPWRPTHATRVIGGVNEESARSTDPAPHIHA